MKRATRPKISLAQHLLDSEVAAGFLERDADELSAVTSGHVGAHTARAIRALCTELRKMTAAQQQRRPKSATEFAREATRTARGIVAAMRYASSIRDDATLTRNLTVVRSKCPLDSVSIAETALALEAYAGVVRANVKALRGFATLADAETLAKLAVALREASAERSSRQAARQRQTAKRDELLAQLARHLADVRGARALLATRSRA